LRRLFSAWFGGFRKLGRHCPLGSGFRLLLPASDTFAGAEFERAATPRPFCGVSIIRRIARRRTKKAAESLRRARDDLAVTARELQKTNEALRAEKPNESGLKVSCISAGGTPLSCDAPDDMGELTARSPMRSTSPLTAVVNNANACLDLLDPRRSGLSKADRAPFAP